MKNIIFKNVAFIKDFYTGARVSGNKMIISAGNEYEVFFESNEKALAGLAELHSVLNDDVGCKNCDCNSKCSQNDNDNTGIIDEVQTLINGIKDGSVLNAINGVKEKLSSKVKDVKHGAQEKAMKIAFEQIFKDGSNTIDKVMSDLDKAMNMLFPENTVNDEENSSKSNSTEKEKTERKFSVDDIFNTLNVGQKQNNISFEQIMTSNKIIADMSTTELRNIIDVFIDDIINSEKGKDMINSIKMNFGSSEVDDAINKFKSLAYEICTENANLTFSQVMHSYFL